MDLPSLVDTLVELRTPAGSAPLAVLAELLDDASLRQRCRQELASRREKPLGWAAQLPQVQVHTAARLVGVLGDAEYVVLGARLGEHEMTCVVRLDHAVMSEVSDAFLEARTVEAVLADVRQNNDERDFIITELSLADAGARITHGMNRFTILPHASTETWPNSRPLVQWLARRLPQDGTRYTAWPGEPSDDDEFLETFFASPAGRAFDDSDCQTMLSLVCMSGHGDPRRWSPARLRDVLDPRTSDHADVPAATLLELPRLLRAYIPFAHAHAGIRDELTAESLDVIERVRTRYQRAVLEDRDLWEDESLFLGTG